MRRLLVEGKVLESTGYSLATSLKELGHLNSSYSNIIGTPEEITAYEQFKSAQTYI